MSSKFSTKKTAAQPSDYGCKSKEPHMILRFALIDTVIAAALLLVITGALFLVRNQKINEAESTASFPSNHVVARIPIGIEPRPRTPNPTPPGIIMNAIVERVNGVPIAQSSDVRVEVGDQVQYRIDYKPWQLTLEAPFDLTQAYDPGYLRFERMYENGVGPDTPITQGFLRWTDVSQGVDVPSFTVKTIKPIFTALKAGAPPGTNLQSTITIIFDEAEYYSEETYGYLTIDSPPPLPEVTVSRSSLNTPLEIDEGGIVRVRVSLANTGSVALTAPVAVTVKYNANYLNFVGTETTPGTFSISSDSVSAAQVVAGGSLVWSDVTGGSGIPAGTSKFFGIRFTASQSGARPNTNINISVAAQDARNRVATDSYTIAGLVVNALPEEPEPAPEPEPVAQQILQTIQDFFALSREQEDVVRTVVAPSTAIINAINLAAAANPLNIGYLFLLLFTEPLQLIMRRRRGAFSVVYNALTKHPLSLAMVRLIEAESGRVIKTAVSDPKGRFSLSGPPGKYRIKISKAGFVFPAKTVSGTTDAGFTNVYNGGTFKLTADKPTVTASIPLDPPRTERTQKALWRKKLYNIIRNIIAWAGIIVAVILALMAPSALTIGLLIAHVVLFFLFRYFARLEAPPTWGMVYDYQTGKPVRGAVVRIYDAQYERLLDSKVTNRRGRYGFLIGENEYLLDVAKEGYQFPAPEKKKSHDYLGGKFTPRQGSIKLNIPIKSQKK